MNSKTTSHLTSKTGSATLRPIGVFDSGVGGLSVWREIVRQLGHENTIYFADQGHVPYGPRLMGEILAFSSAIVRFLLEHHCKLIAVACNTASAAALQALRLEFPTVPFVGMEPAIKPAAQYTHTRKVGVLATPATFQGKLFTSVVERFAAGVELINQVCPGLVGQVEAGKLDSPDTLEMLHKYLSPILAKGADTIVLACTHYPFLTPAIQRIVGPEVQIIDPGPAIARQVSRVLERKKLLAPAKQVGRHIFYTTGDPQAFSSLLSRLTNRTDGDVRQARWEGTTVGSSSQ